MVKKCLSNQHQQNFCCDDDVHDVVVKRTKKNKLTLVNIEAETNVVCTLKNMSGDSEEAREIGNSGNNDKVRSPDVF